MTAFRVFAVFAVVFSLLAAARAQVKTAVPLPVKPAYETSLQAVVVVTPNWQSVPGTGRLFERKKPSSKWKAVGVEFPVVVGRTGLGADIPNFDTKPLSPIKREGDGRSPAGMFPLISTFGIGSMQDAVKLPYIKLDEFTECVDDTRSSFYNQIVNRMQVGNFDWKSSEKMFTVRPQYELGVFVAYNSYPAIRGNGSCIFLHIWKDATTATSGCTAMAREELERIVKWLDPAKNPYLVQMTEAEYNSHRKSLRLPKLK